MAKNYKTELHIIWLDLENVANGKAGLGLHLQRW